MNTLSKSQLMPITRALSVVGGLALCLVLLFPIWEIHLTAPQYPEGLELYIHTNKLSGQVDIINGLNNYIGMRHIKEDEFVEFKVLPYLFIFIGVIGILAGALNKRWLFFTWGVIFVLFAVLAMGDFYIWLYDYGHELDPSAPIKVPGMTYQPPLIGYKQLLNFGAFSIPGIGGWIMAGVGAIIVGLSVFELKYRKK